MPCNNWNDEWVAHLYEELDPAEESRLEEHIASCAECRLTLEELSASREVLQKASPPVPATPRVVVLKPRGFLQPMWAYAAGMACALLLFGVGLLAGYRLPGITGGGTELTPVAATEGGTAVQAQLDSILARLNHIEQASTGRPAGPVPAYLTRAQLEEAMNNQQRLIDVKRARDFEFLLREITATELRTGTYIDETREALRYVAMQSDPRFTER
jgi:anti-sigma factor RsiW